MRLNVFFVSPINQESAKEVKTHVASNKTYVILRRFQKCNRKNGWNLSEKTDFLRPDVTLFEEKKSPPPPLKASISWSEIFKWTLAREETIENTNVTSDGG
jgi:hypothetical protein